ncbi:MAG: hypothetical protein JW725_05020 [Candidatus Babeliaceae bacterium]|nr:hypothetical protein [Candidatus Babeliaceae bacterium]
MDVRNRVHDVRQTLGMQRQPEWGDTLQNLNRILIKSSQNNPYSSAARLELENEIRSFAGKGLQGASGEWLFSICSTAKLPRCTDWRFLQVGLPSWKIHDALTRQYRRTGSWLNLTQFAAGETRFPLGIAWFSDQEPDQNLVCAGHLRGMPNDWIQTHSVILRCRSTDIATIIKIPTVVDGFLSPIFMPVETNLNPKAGMAISLEPFPNDLDWGVSEWILGNIPVNLVDIKPVLATSTDYAKHRVSLVEDSLWAALDTFYQDQLSKSKMGTT